MSRTSEVLEERGVWDKTILGLSKGFDFRVGTRAQGEDLGAWVHRCQDWAHVPR